MPVLKPGYMLEEYEKKRRKQISIVRSLMNYAMGAVFIAAGIFFLIRERFDIIFNEKYPPNYMDKILGGIFVLYGAWRVYRGYKKNYCQ